MWGVVGSFNGHFISSLLLSPMVKEFWKSVNTWQRYGHEYDVLVSFWLMGRECLIVYKRKGKYK